MMPGVSIRQFEELLPKICDQKTTSDPKNWTPGNPLWGHCEVVSLVAQNLFGGKLLRASLENTKYADMRSHYCNNLPHFNRKSLFSEERDFTASQFKLDYPAVSLISEPRERSYVLSHSETYSRYKLLAWRLAKELNKDNPLFESDIYQKCFYNALDSPCQKMKFGANIVHQVGDIIYRYTEGSSNEIIEPLKSLCEPNCIRFNIISRTESMIGACSHAEENLLWKAVKAMVTLDKCDLYVAGIYSNGLPYIKAENEFTCLRCAVQIYNSGIERVFVPVVNNWRSLTGEECVKSARAYAMGEKKI